MKYTTLLGLTLTLLLAPTAKSVSSIDLSTFGSSVEGLDWTWTPATSVLSGTEALGAVLFPTAFGGADLTTLDLYSGPSSLLLNFTGLVTTAPPGAFLVSLEDGLGNVSATPILWSSFTTSSSTVIASVNTAVPAGFQWNNIAGWTIDSGGSGSAVNATFTQLSVTAVPEPSTYALLAGGAVVLSGYAMRRRRRA